MKIYNYSKLITGILIFIIGLVLSKVFGYPTIGLLTTLYGAVKIGNCNNPYYAKNKS